MLSPFVGLKTGGKEEFLSCESGRIAENKVVWYVMLCHWMNNSHCFEGSQGLHPQGQSVQEE
jgi:hypothetical protein